MESEGVSLPLIHEHLMVPWNHIGKGDCCGGFEVITDGYYCEECDFFVHKKCSESSEYIQHPSHPAHTLQLQREANGSCGLCGSEIWNLSYHCDVCDFDMDLYCVKYPPPEVIDVSVKHRHKLTLLKKRIEFDCDTTTCRKKGYGFPYKCDDCDSAFHVDCVWHPSEVKHPLEYTTMNAGERVLLPWIHKHFMMPWNSQKKGSCCKRYEIISDGYYCKICNLFFHKKCSDKAPQSIQHPSHSIHPLWLQLNQKYSYLSCNSCGKNVKDLFYRCHICDIHVDLCCATYPPPEVIDISKKHHHKLTLLKKRIDFTCDAKCGEIGYEFPYKCNECDLAFHVDCVWQPNIVSKFEVNHSYHPWHPLTLHTGQPPEYSDGKCRLCGEKIKDRFFYHCSSCNFTLDMRCVLHPPPPSFLDLKVHHHQLSILPRFDSFTCNACGLKGDRSPYICVQCGFIIHQDCLRLPRVININRHDHRVSRTSVLGVVNSVCGVCRKNVDWTCGGYSCQRCPDYVVHSKCATRGDVWNGRELEDVPEEIEDIEPYVVIDENTIQHFSHKEHHLKRNGNGLLWEESKWCRACTHPIGLQSFYGCIDCDFVLHQNCAEFPKRKWHMLHNERLTLVTNETTYFRCAACQRMSNGFAYQDNVREIDVRCGSISEPFVHLSHPLHPLYHIPQGEYGYGYEYELCNGCNKKKEYVLRCIEDGCKFVLCFGCATLPQVVKHRVDDHPLSLRYGEEDASGKYWCDICEKESDPREWFYTCKDHRANLHTKCVLGDCAGFMPRSTITYYSETYEVVLNTSVTRPLCQWCESRCMYPIFLKLHGTSVTYYFDAYYCSYKCALDH